MNFNGQVRQWFAGLERSDKSVTSTDLSGRLVSPALPDKSVEVTDLSDLYKVIADVDR